jgi:hypothetical protein
MHRLVRSVPVTLVSGELPRLEGVVIASIRIPTPGIQFDRAHSGSTRKKNCEDGSQETRRRFKHFSSPSRAAFPVVGLLRVDPARGRVVSGRGPFCEAAPLASVSVGFEVLITRPIALQVQHD